MPSCHCSREKDKKKKKGDADAESGGDSTGSPGDDATENEPEEVVWMTDTSEQAAKDRAQAQLTKAMADMVTQASTHVLSPSSCRQMSKPAIDTAAEMDQKSVT